MNIELPELSLVLLVGVSGSGKSTFARKHFKPTEILSSDFCRGLVADDENDQTATTAAFAVLHSILRERLKAGRLTVIDATNVQPEARKPLVAIAREFHVLPVAVVVDIDEATCRQRNLARPDRAFGPHVIRMQASQLRRGLRGLRDEGFRHIFRLDSVAAIEETTVARVPLWNNKKDDHGPFDIIGDVHGCLVELRALLAKLGWDTTQEPPAPPPGRKAVFVGDLVDRGPDSPGVLKLVMALVQAGSALCVPGNHEVKLLKLLNGKKVSLKHGLERTAQQLEAETPEWKASVARFVDGLVSHVVLDGGNLVVAHAGLKAEMQGRGSGAVRQFCLFGETTGETDEFGLPVRYNWAADYRGSATVVYGHTPVPEATWLNRTLCIDTGCVFGGKLTALRWPEKAIVAVPALAEHYPPTKPLVPAARADAFIDIGDVQGKRIVSTRFGRNITIREENGAAALEVLSRFAVDPEWLITLPPTMSPVTTCETGPELERPEQAFAYFKDEGVAEVVVEEKHMGSRALVVVAKDANSARRRFGINDGSDGVIVTRTGRRFFNDASLEQALLSRIRSAAVDAGLWDELHTDWLCLDCELMPWSVKAQELVSHQYAHVGSAAAADTGAVVAALTRSVGHLPETAALLAQFAERQQNATSFNEVFRRYCWNVGSVDDLRLAPFHLLASEGAVHDDKDHVWHMETLGRLATHPSLQQTAWRLVNLDDDDRVADCVAWWEELTRGGGEGVVVKPRSFLQQGTRGLVQPALKVRGREYLRLIYGPDYTVAENLDRLRQRAVGARRSLAQREFMLGLEALHRFVDREPLHRVHECVFGVLALESEPADPIL